MLRITLFRLIVVLFALFAFNTIDSAARTDLIAPAVEWVRQFDATDAAGDEQVTAIAGENDVYVVGYTMHALPGQTDLDTAFQEDAFIRKYDVNGNELWTRQFGTVGSDRAEAVAADAAGAFVVGIEFGNGSAEQAFVYRFDANGNVLWVQKFGSTMGTKALSAVIAEGALYVTGFTFGALPGQTALGFADAYIRKYDFNGNEIWTRQFGTTGNDPVEGIATDGSHIYVVGYTSGDMAGQTNAGDFDVFVAKFDNSGNQLWVRQFGSSGYDEAQAIDVSGTDVFVVGRTSGTLPGQTSTGQYDSFIRRYDVNGNEVWTRQFGTPFDDGAFGVAINGDRVNVTGSGRYSAESQTNFDVYVHALDGNGNQVWAQQFGANATQNPNSVAPDDEVNGILVIGSDVYIAGTTNSALAGQLNMAQAGAFVRKYTFDGAESWTQQFGAVQRGQGAWANGIAVHNGVYVAGRTDAAFPGQPHLGSSDGFVLRYDLDGTNAWVRQIGSNNSDVATSVAADDSGVYVGYVSTNTDIFAAGTGYIRKYDSSGGEIWVKEYGRSIQSIAVNDSGLYAVGTRQSGMHVTKFDRDGNEIWSQPLANTDTANILSLDDSGVYVWGNPNDDRRYIVKYQLDGTSAWTISLSQATIGCFAPNATIGPAGIFLFGSDCARRYDLNGNEIWRGSVDMPFGAQYGTDSSHIYQASAGTQIDVRKTDFVGNEVWTQSITIANANFGNSYEVSQMMIDDTHVYILGRVGTSTGNQVRTVTFLAKITKEAINYTEFLYLPVVDGN